MDPVRADADESTFSDVHRKIAKVIFGFAFVVVIIAISLSAFGSRSTSAADCAKLGGIKSRSTDQCFIHVNEEKTFIQAELLCEAKFGGHLASIHSGFDNLYVADFSRELFPYVDQYYIGLATVHDNKEMWQDGTQLDYTNFGSKLETGKCTTVDMESAKWYEIDCFTKACFVCSV
uniref:C-type lectin domain-containing protein n=1 Tax=Panagrellus redivivus TaxID=6233 RepID=A0A7E4V7X2_PANRE